MQVNAALLCDFASVRENLLNVVGGGITRLWRADLPAALEVSLALVLELHRMELHKPHELEIVVVSEDGAEVISIRGGFNADADLPFGENLLMPLAFDLRPGGVERYGTYAVEVSIDGTHHRSVQFQVTPATPPAPPPGGRLDP